LEILYFVALNSLGHLGFVGCRMTTTLFALKLGASPALAGIVVAMFAVVPMLLSVSAGRLIDRVGPRRPVGAALALLTGAALLPFLVPTLGTLLVSSVLAGVGFMFLHIGMNSVIGAHGRPEQRAVNFSWLALSFSISGASGPLVGGYAIEGLGHAAAFAVLALFPALALGLLLAPGLRRTFIVSGMLATGWDLYGFLLPLYGTQLGIEPARIGLIMATFAFATFAVRLALQVLIRRVRQWVLIAGSMSVAASAYLLFPFVTTAPLLTALSFVLGLGLGCSQPVIMSLLYEASPAGRQSEAVGVRTTMINASQTFIPLASGALSLAIGVAPLFWILAATLFGGAWFARHRIRAP
jgi:MFS family permease